MEERSKAAGTNARRADRNLLDSSVLLTYLIKEEFLMQIESYLRLEKSRDLVVWIYAVDGSTLNRITSR